MRRYIKIAMCITLLFISVGYAAINSSLDLRTLLSIGFNAEDFQVYVSRVELDDVNISTGISEDQNSFTFTAYSTSNTLSYRVRNLSTQYDAYVTLACTHPDSVTLNINHVGTIAAQTIETRTIEIENGNTDEITCTLAIDKVSRTSTAGNSCCSNASEIEFTPEDSKWTVTTVEEAINYLRARSN